MCHGHPSVEVFTPPRADCYKGHPDKVNYHPKMCQSTHSNVLSIFPDVQEPNSNVQGAPTLCLGSPSWVSSPPLAPDAPHMCQASCILKLGLGECVPHLEKWGLIRGTPHSWP